MSTVTFRQPRNAGYAGFHRAAYAPILDQLRESQVFALYVGDTVDCAMFREARSDCNFRKLNKREMFELAAEIAEVAEAMDHHNPFLFSNMQREIDGKLGLDMLWEMISTDEESRAEARRLMLAAREKEGGWSDETIESFLLSGRQKSDQAKQKVRDRLLDHDLRNNEANVLGREVCSLRDKSMHGWLLALTCALSAMMILVVGVWFWPMK